MESDCMSLLLDNMFTAVEEGFSYDGIVSLPETGLEDAGKQPGVGGWVERRMKSCRKMMRVVQRAFGFSPQPNPPSNNKPDSSTGSGLGTSDEKPPAGGQETSLQGKDEDSRSPSPSDNQPGTGNSRMPRLRNPTAPPPSDSPEAPEKGDEEAKDDGAYGEVQVGPSAQAEPPGGLVSPSPSDSPKLPRKKSENVLESIARGDDGEHVAQPDPSVREKLPRLKGGQAALPPPDSPKSPRKRRQKALEDTVHGESMPGPSTQEKSPRLRGGQTMLPPPDSPNMPRKRSKQLLGDIACQDASQTPENESGGAAIRHPDTDGTELLAGESPSQRAGVDQLPRIKKI